MPEAEIGDPVDRATAFQHGKISIETDFPQYNHNLNVPQQIQFPLKKRAAIAKFLRRRFVSGRRAMPCRSDPGIVQFKTVIGASALRLGSESRCVERPVEEITGTVPCKHTSSTISTMGSGSEAKNQQPRARIAERRYWFTPIIPFEERPAFGDGNFPAVLDQTGTTLAPYNLAVQRDKVLFVTVRCFKWMYH